MKEYAVDKCRVTVLIPIETRVKLNAKYGTPEKEGKPGKNEAIVKAIEDIVKDVKLTKTQLDAVREEIAENYRARMAERERLYGSRQKAKHGFGKRRLAAEARARAAEKASAEEENAKVKKAQAKSRK